MFGSCQLWLKNFIEACVVSVIIPHFNGPASSVLVHQTKKEPLPLIYNCYGKRNKRGKAGDLVTELIVPICVQGS